MDVGVLAYPAVSGRELISFAKTVTTAGTPVRLTTSHVLTNRFTVYGAKTVNRGVNTGSVFIGDANDQLQQLVPYDPTLAGGEVVYQAPVGSMFDLSEFWIDAATNGDGVVVSYLG